MLFFLCLFLFAELIKTAVAEVKADINGDHNEVKNVEEEAENEEKIVSYARIKGLNSLADYSTNISKEKENLKKETLSLCGTSYVRLADRDRPG